MKRIGRVLMYWYDRPTGIPREREVELIELHESETIIRTDVDIPVKTLVYLKSGIDKLDGFVVSCCREDVSFVLRINELRDLPTAGVANPIDPGVFNVESFWTAEQEEALLKQLADCEDNQSVESRLPKREITGDEPQSGYLPPMVLGS